MTEQNDIRSKMPNITQLEQPIPVLDGIDPETFCVAPWFQIRNENSGQMKPCCRIDPKVTEFDGRVDFHADRDHVETYMQSDWLRYIRDSLMSGKKISECHRCWNNERHGVVSERQILNDLMKADGPWLQSYFKTQNHQSWMILSADWKYSNLCNLGCVMCHPVDSSRLYSQWHQNKDHHIVQKSMAGHDWQQIVEIFRDDKQMQLFDRLLCEPHLRYIKILGGEPLMHDQVIERLLDIPDDRRSKISVHFVTNGTHDMISVIDKLADFRAVTFTVSVDATGWLQEWIRAGSDWNSVCHNILRARERTGVYVQCLIQILNIAHLTDLWNWCVTHDLPLNFNILSQPQHLSIAALPLDKRHNILQNMKKQLIAHEIPSHEHDVLKFDKLMAQIMAIAHRPLSSVDLYQHIKLHADVNGFEPILETDIASYFGLGKNT